MTNYDLAKKYLKPKEFRRYVKECKKDFLELRESKLCLASSFPWANSLKGHEYWSKLRTVIDKKQLND
jgi:hypothetical protein